MFKDINGLEIYPWDEEIGTEGATQLPLGGGGGSSIQIAPSRPLTEIFNGSVRPGTGISNMQCDILGTVRQNGNLIGPAGTRPNIRVVSGGTKAAEKYFALFSKGGSLNTPAGYPGVRYRLPNGDYIGYRPMSKSGPPTIDLNINGLEITKIKFIE